MRQRVQWVLGRPRSERQVHRLLVDAVAFRGIQSGNDDGVYEEAVVREHDDAGDDGQETEAGERDEQDDGAEEEEDVFFEVRGAELRNPGLRLGWLSRARS